LKGVIMTVFLLVIISIMSSCNSSERNITTEQANFAADKDILSATCQVPPKTFTWNKQKYRLKTIGERDLEPGMKIGYMSCDTGTYTQQAEGINATFNIYTYGSHSSDLLYFGKWGRALYTAE
jgi:hypothetical protein